MRKTITGLRAIAADTLTAETAELKQSTVHYQTVVTNTDIKDAIVSIAYGNTADSVDAGIVFHYNNGAQRQAAIVRDQTDGKIKFLRDVTTTIDASVDLDTLPRATVVTGATETGALSCDGGLAITTGALTVAGESTLSGAVDAKDGLTVETKDLTVSAGDVKITTGGLSVAGTSTLSGAVTAADGLTVSSGDLKTTVGSASIATSLTTGTGLTVSAGLTSLGGSLQVASTCLFNGNVTLGSGDTLRFSNDLTKAKIQLLHYSDIDDSQNTYIGYVNRDATYRGMLFTNGNSLFDFFFASTAGGSFPETGHRVFTISGTEHEGVRIGTIADYVQLKTTGSGHGTKTVTFPAATGTAIVCTSTDTVSLTYTGNFSAAVTGTVTLQKLSTDCVMVQVRGFNGTTTSAGAVITSTAIPSGYWPSTTAGGSVVLTDTGTIIAGTCTVSTVGVLSFRRYDGGNFGVGTVGAGDCSFILSVG